MDYRELIARDDFPKAWGRLLQSVDLAPENKRCHLWIHGKRNSHKTHFLERLIELGVRCFQAPYNDDWVGFDQDYHQIIFADEYSGQLTIQKLNEMCNTYAKLNTKGGSITKTRKVLVIILSNFTPEECYKKAIESNPDIIDTIYARFRKVEFIARDTPEWAEGVEQLNQGPLLPAKRRRDPTPDPDPEPFDIGDVSALFR